MFKTTGDYSKSIPVKTPHFNKDNAKSIEFARDSAYDGIAQAFGKFSVASIMKRRWLKDVNFKLSSLTKDNKQEFTLDFDYTSYNPSCQINVSFLQVFFNFRKIVKLLNFLKKSDQKCIKKSI